MSAKKCMYFTLEIHVVILCVMNGCRIHSVWYKKLRQKLQFIANLVIINVVSWIVEGLVNRVSSDGSVNRPRVSGVTTLKASNGLS